MVLGNIIIFDEFDCNLNLWLCDIFNVRDFM